ncbi:hypothetical protein AgCh_025868 [Apium graveolens]
MIEMKTTLLRNLNKKRFEEKKRSKQRSMWIALNARNKFVLVNGTYSKPAKSSLLYAQWERVNDLVITWILNSVVDDTLDGLNYVTTASEAWDKLREYFSGVSGHRIFQVLKNIHSLEQGNRNVEVYFHKLKGLWGEYIVLEPKVDCVCGAYKVQIERDQKRKLLQFLMGLHDSNYTIRGQILMITPMPTISQAYAYVKQDERTRQGFHSPVQKLSPFANALVANSSADASASTNWKKKKEAGSVQNPSQFCTLPKNIQANSALTGSMTSSNDQMHNMQSQINHISQMMSFFMGNSIGKGSPEDHLVGMVTSKVGLVVSQVSKCVWLIDSVPTGHIFFSLDLLVDVKPLPVPIHLAFPNDASLLVTQIGSYKVHSQFKLHNVLFVLGAIDDIK